MNFNEFTDIEFPASLIARGFTDASWHNDAAARAVLERQNLPQITVWVDCDDAAEREIPGSMKFAVVTETDYGEDIEERGVFDDEAGMLACVDTLIREAAAA